MTRGIQYKDTEIGKIPREWEVVRLGSKYAAEIIMGQSPPSSTYNKRGQGIPFLQGKAEFGGIYPSPIMFCSNPQKIAESNDILISVRAPVGDVNIAPFRCCIGRGLASIRPNSHKLSPPFMFYLLKFQKRKLENLSTGSTFKAIKRKDIENLEFPLPPLPEQQKIAEILSTADEAIQKVDEAIEKTQRLKKGLMQELLSKGIGHEEFKETGIGRIPKEWEVVRLRDVTLGLLGGGTPSTSNRNYWDGNIPWMTSAHITGRIVANAQRNITNDGLRNSATNLVPKDNLLVATRVGIGKAAINKVDIAISQDLTGVIIDKAKSTPDFLYWCIISNERRLKSLAQGSTIKGLLREDLGKLNISLPPLPEQQKIAEILSTVDKRLELLRRRKEKLEKVKKGLMNDLLTGKRRVTVEA